MLMSWPDGPQTALHIAGRARDLLTAHDLTTEVVDESTLDVVVSAERMIERIVATPPISGLQTLTGARGGGNLRAAINAAVPEEKLAGTALYLLLDDIAGCTLIGGFAWSRHADIRAAIDRSRIPVRVMEGICSGFRPGASSLLADGTMSGLVHNVAAVPSIADPDDPLGWHQLPDHPALAMRRARRIDVWCDDGRWSIDCMFRDSAWEPDGTEVAVHEYQVTATADPDDGCVASVVATPRVLPYAECPGAAANADLIVGAPLRELRAAVLDRIKGVECCTHLNDALRSLAEVPALVQSLRA
ncbi:MAG: hypothetical protein JWN62_4578 [Acidimicrobiales bacterium]|nr:hypothetical protein [Acidimicrobiales bacterium]